MYRIPLTGLLGHKRLQNQHWGGGGKEIGKRFNNMTGIAACRTLNFNLERCYQIKKKYLHSQLFKVDTRAIRVER